MATDFRDLLKQAKLPERSIPICLRGDLTADHEAAERDLEAAQRRPVDSLAGNGVGPLVERIEALEAEMAEDTYPFRLRALPKPTFRALVAAHPPRRDPETGDVNADDAPLNLNRETFFDALIRACVVDPDLTDDEWTELLGERLTDRQVGDLEDAAWFLNRDKVDVPFSRAASLHRRSSDPG